MAYKLIGQNFTPPDVVAKVTGQAKYAEDFRAEGMVFCRLLTSPMPHARVLNIDATEALKMEGVVGILTPDEMPPIEAPGAMILTKEPQYIGAPILAVAALSETLAQDAIEKIKIDYEPLPFTVDPLQSLLPDGPNARSDGNVGANNVKLQTVKWTAGDFAAAGEGKLPMGKPAEEWTIGPGLDETFAQCKVVYDETFVTASLSHHSMEPRTCMAYWQNGKCFVHASLQSHTFAVPPLAKMLGVPLDDVVLIAEFCGGGFGSKGSAYPVMAIAPLMARKISWARRAVDFKDA
jgi:xanthine dehydrogenase molybdenum-binding subunit